MPSNPRIVFLNDELMHYGIMGQKWGKRRYQNDDGTLTPEGRERYAKAAGAKLTSLDRKSDRDRANLNDAKIRVERATRKIDRNSTKARAQLKAKKKLAKATSDADKYTKKISGNMDNVQKLIDELNSDGFSTIGKGVQRTAMSNRDALRSMATSLIGIYWETKVPGFAYDVVDERRVQHSALAHHGIKGQKWGVRRFQNPDGTLTPAGRKRRAKYEAKINKRTKKLRAKMDEEGLNTDEKRPKTLSEMSIDELNTVLERQRLEAQIYKAQIDRATSVAALKEAQKSKARKLLEDSAPKLVDQVLIPVAKDKLDKGTDALLRSVGLDLSSPMEKLQREATMSKLRADIADNNKRARDANKAPSALDDLKRRADEAKYLADIADSNKRENEARNGSPLASLKLKADEAKYLADIADSNNRAKKANAKPDITAKEAKALAKKKYDVDLADLEAKLARAQTQLSNNGYDPKGSNKGIDLSDPNEVQKLVDAFRKAGVNI